MHGSLALAQGVVYVGRCARSAILRTFDLDGHPLEGGFEFVDEEHGRSTAAGLAVDTDHRVWVADSAAGKVRAFTLFGRPIVSVPSEEGDKQGGLGRPVDLAATGCDDGFRLAVASGGRRRHALQVFDPKTGAVLSLRPEAGPRGQFQDLRGITWHGADLYVSEAGSGAVHVYRDGALHWSVHLPVAGARRFQPTGCAVLSDGSMLITCGDEDASALIWCHPGGRVRRILAESGTDEGQLDEPLDVVVEEHADGGPRAVVIDRVGERVQVFTLEGRCYGAFPTLTG